MEEKSYRIGYLLRSDITGFVAGTRVLEQDAPRFGALARVQLNAETDIYGLIYDITVVDDGLVRQLVTAENVDPTVIADNRTNRNVPLEMSILALGYKQGDSIRHTLPPRPPLSLDEVHQCADEEVVAFTTAGRFGYLRHLLRNPELPVAELAAAHVAQAAEANEAAGNASWRKDAAKELITLLRDDYQMLMQVLNALGDGFAEMAAQ